MDVDKLRDVTFDLETLTLGEAGEAERQSGMPLSAMLKSPHTRRILGLFVHLSRTSADKPSWSELSNLRLLDVSPSTSPEPKDSPSETSNV
jgi:hypothetical protein